jgi:hypothetical protein
MIFAALRLAMNSAVFLAVVTIFGAVPSAWRSQPCRTPDT